MKLLQRHIFFTAFARAGSTFFNFLIALLIARFSGPEVKGEVTLFITTSWFFIFFSNVLGGHALVYLLQRGNTTLLVFPAYLWSLLISLLGFGFLHVASLLYAEQIPLVAVVSFLSAVVSIHQTLLLSNQQIVAANVLTLLPLLLQTAGVVYCYLTAKTFGVEVYTYSTLTAYLLTLPVSIWLVRKNLSLRYFLQNFRWHEVKSSFLYGLQFQLVEVLQLLNLRLYFFQLGLQQGSRYLGIFSVGISVLESVWLIPRSIATVHYVNTSQAKEVEREAERTVSLMKFNFLLVTTALLVLALVPADWFAIVFGESFGKIKHATRFLYPGIWLYSFWMVMSGFYFGTAQYKPLMISSLAGSVVLAACSAYLLPVYVMSGAGLAATLGMGTATTVLLAFFFTRQNHRD